jgi:hypothetical protein
MDVYSISENNHYVIINRIPDINVYDDYIRQIFLDKNTLHIKRCLVKTTLSTIYLSVEHNSMGCPSQIHSFKRYHHCKFFNVNENVPDDVNTQRFEYDFMGRLKSFEDSKGNWWDYDIMGGSIPFAINYNKVIDVYNRALHKTQPNIRLSTNSDTWEEPNPNLVVSKLSKPLSQIREIIRGHISDLYNMGDIHAKPILLGEREIING